MSSAVPQYPGQWPPNYLDGVQVSAPLPAPAQAPPLSASKSLQPSTPSSASADPPGSMLPDALDPASLAALMKNLQSIYSPLPSGIPGVQDLLSKLFGSLYDPSQDYKTLSEKSALASTLPTQARRDADAAQVQAQGAEDLLKQLQGVTVPQQGMLPQPDLPALELPGAPPVAKPQVSPLASLLTVAAGFAAPKAAGQFNAATLEGALQGAAQENARRQQANKEEITRRSLVYDASMNAAKERQRVLELNRDAAFQNSVLTTDKQLSLAKTRADAMIAQGTAKSLKDFADKYDPAIKAANDVKSLYDAIDTKGKVSAEQVKSISELLSSVEKASNGPGATLGKDVFDAYVKASLQQKEQANILNRQQLHDKNLDARARQQEQAISAREMALAAMRDANAMKRLNIEEAGKDRRQKSYLENTKTNKPSQELVQSQENQKRLQSRLGEIEKALSEARATYPKTPEVVQRINQLVRMQSEFSKTLQEEQLRAMRFDPRGAGTPLDTEFDPTTGDLIPR